MKPLLSGKKILLACWLLIVFSCIDFLCRIIAQGVVQKITRIQESNSPVLTQEQFITLQN
jgi:hypothetical protein